MNKIVIKPLKKTGQNPDTDPSKSGTNLRNVEDNAGLDVQNQNPDVVVEKRKFGIPEPKWSPPDLFRRRNRPTYNTHNIVNALNEFATRPSGLNFTNS